MEDFIQYINKELFVHCPIWIFFLQIRRNSLTHKPKTEPVMSLEQKTRMLGSIVSRIASPTQIQKCIKKWKWENFFGGEKKFKKKKNSENESCLKLGEGGRGVLPQMDSQLDDIAEWQVYRVAPCEQQGRLKNSFSVADS